MDSKSVTDSPPRTAQPQAGNRQARSGRASQRLTASLILLANRLSLLLSPSTVPLRRSRLLPATRPAVCFALPRLSCALYLTPRTTLLIRVLMVMAYLLLAFS